MPDRDTVVVTSGDVGTLPMKPEASECPVCDGFGLLPNDRTLERAGGDPTSAARVVKCDHCKGEGTIPKN